MAYQGNILPAKINQESWSYRLINLFGYTDPHFFVFYFLVEGAPLYIRVCESSLPRRFIG